MNAKGYTITLFQKPYGFFEDTEYSHHGKATHLLGVEDCILCASIQEGQLINSRQQTVKIRKNKLNVRVDERTAGIVRLLREREEKETADIEAIMTELAEAIEKELAEPGYRQLELFTDNERSQLIRNTEALQARLQQIPVEIQAEQKVIRDRFADPSPRLFPVAVTFLVPERLS